MGRGHESAIRDESSVASRRVERMKRVVTSLGAALAVALVLGLPVRGIGVVGAHPISAAAGVLQLADEGISEPGSLDPVLFDGQSMVVDSTIYNGLVKLDAYLLPAPDLASGWTVS